MSTLSIVTRVGYLASLVEEKANFTIIAKQIEAEATLIDKSNNSGLDVYQYKIGEDVLVLIVRNNIILQAQLHSSSQEDFGNVFQHLQFMSPFYTLVREQAGVKYFLEENSDVITCLGFDLHGEGTYSVIFSHKEIPNNI